MTLRERAEYMAEVLLDGCTDGPPHEHIAAAIEREAKAFAERALRQWCPKNNSGSGVILSHVEEAIAEAIAAAEREET